MAAARDGQAAQEALADLGDSFPKSARSRATIAERIAQIRAGAEAIGLTPERGARIDDMWTRAAAAVERWPFERFDRSEAAAQLTAFYRRVLRRYTGRLVEREPGGAAPISAGASSSIATRWNLPTRCGRSSCACGFPRRNGCATASARTTTS